MFLPGHISAFLSQGCYGLAQLLAVMFIKDLLTVATTGALGDNSTELDGHRAASDILLQ